MRTFRYANRGGLLRSPERFWRRRTLEFGLKPELLAFLRFSHNENRKSRRRTNCLICNMRTFRRFSHNENHKSRRRTNCLVWICGLLGSAYRCSTQSKASLRYAGFLVREQRRASAKPGAILAASNRQNRGALHCKKGKLHKTVRAPFCLYCG